MQQSRRRTVFPQILLNPHIQSLPKGLTCFSNVSPGVFEPLANIHLCQKESTFSNISHQRTGHTPSVLSGLAYCTPSNTFVSTSNHNTHPDPFPSPSVVSYSVSTSNHNTAEQWCPWPVCCILFCFYIKPQQGHRPFETQPSCILFCFYIKPQPKSNTTNLKKVVSYSVSTSNHNANDPESLREAVVSYSVSTSNHNHVFWNIAAVYCCILFCFYIKPQQSNELIKSVRVVSYSVSTSNHNFSD